MPKKSAAVVHKGARRNQVKTRKHIELVPAEQSNSQDEQQNTSIQEKWGATLAETGDGATIAVQEKVEERESAPLKRSASTRLATRRRGAQRGLSRGAQPLMTAEDYTRVKRELITIVILSSIMIAMIILAYLFFGR